MQKIDPASLLAMDEQAAGNPFRVELAYARPDNLLFGEQIYRPGARLWLHRDLAKIVITAARACFKNHGFRFVLYDGLRPSNAQEAMLQTRRVKENPSWLTGNLLSRPGMGGHPRGMAVDIGLEDESGALLDMGTAFDFLADDPSPEKNPAHRDYKNLGDDIKQRREALTRSMMDAACVFGIPLLPLPQEWWDFRLAPEIFNSYAPLADSDLPPEMRMMDS